jgi:hypothetical protein
MLALGAYDLTGAVAMRSRHAIHTENKNLLIQ